MAAKKKASKAAARGAKAKAKAKSNPKQASTRAARPVRKKPESLRLRGAAPSFTVNDLEKSRTFYRDVLGFVEGELWERDGKLIGLELIAGDVTFMIGQDDWMKGRNRVKGVGFRIYCPTAQDVDVLARDIKARGGTLERDPIDEPWGRHFTIADPDGFKITIANEKRKR